jgi:hypothetical protein
MELIAKYPSNAATYLKDWFALLEKFNHNIEFLEAKIRAAGLCPVPTPFIISRVVSFATL